MATVDGITAERAQEIADASVVSGHINSGNGHLILETGDGTEIDAGLARDDSAVAAEAAARMAADAAITNTSPISLLETTAFIFTNTTPSHNAGSGGTTIEGTIIVPPTGRLLVIASVLMHINIEAANKFVYFGYELRQTNAGGSILAGYSANRAVVFESDKFSTGSVQSIHTGLTPGSTVYIRGMHVVDSNISALSGVINRRSLVVMGC